MNMINRTFGLGCLLILGLSQPLMAESMSMASLGASGAKMALKSVSKSITGGLASSSTSSDSTNDRSDDLKEVVTYGLSIPDLTRPLENRPLEISWMMEPSPEDKIWLEKLAHSQAYAHLLGEIKIKKLSARRSKREVSQSFYQDGIWYVSDDILELKNEAIVEYTLAEMVWEKLFQDQKQVWTMLAGWGPHPVMPWLERDKQIYAGIKKATSAKSDFIETLNALEANSSVGSKSIFLSQLLGTAKRERLDQKEIHKNKVYFAFVNEKGWVGASQGHCALVVENRDGERISVAYTADFNWEQPMRSGIGALVGQNRRLLEMQGYEDFVRVYEAEGRHITLVELKISAEKKNRLLYRLLECQNYEQGKYSFLRQNCANPLRDIFHYASLSRDEELMRWHTPKSLYQWAQKQDERS